MQQYQALKGHPAAGQGDHLDRVRSDQMFLEIIRRGGWPGRAKLSGGQESQTKGQGTVWLPPQWVTAEAARRGPEGQIKELLSRQFTERKQRLKQLQIEALEGQKAARQRKHHG